MKARKFIWIGAVAIALVVLGAREWTRTDPEQLRSVVTSAERPPAPRGTEQMRTPASAAERPAAMSTRTQRPSELRAQEESAIADAPQGYEQRGTTQKPTGKNVYEQRRPVAAELFDEMVSSGPSLEAMHRRFSEEESDPNWSPNVEAQLQNSIQNEETTRLVDVASMECRKTVCRIQAVAPSKELNAQSMEALQNRIFTMPRESWWTGYGLKVPLFAVTFAPDGRAIMVAYVATH